MSRHGSKLSGAGIGLAPPDPAPPRRVDRIRVIVEFYVGMTWVVSYVVSPRVVVIEGIPADAVPLIFDDLTAIIMTDAEIEWTP
jgi:hypothetical protein